jgi:hypothetical protein
MADLAFLEAQADFAVDLLRETSLNATASLIMSPISIALALSLAYAGSVGDTRKQFESVFAKGNFYPSSNIFQIFRPIEYRSELFLPQHFDRVGQPEKHHSEHCQSRLCRKDVEYFGVVQEFDYPRLRWRFRSGRLQESRPSSGSRNQQIRFGEDS